MQLYINSFLEFNLFVLTSMTFSYALVYDIIFENPPGNIYWFFFHVSSKPLEPSVSIVFF